MRRTRPQLAVVMCAVAAISLVGCTSPARNVSALVTTSSSQVQRLPADSPLTECVDPSPATPKPVDAEMARHFADGRVATALSLDDGTFRADPAARDATPKVSATLAFCNMLAGAAANNASVIGAVDANGMSFGLGLVTVSDAVLKTGPQSYIVGAQQQTATLQPYEARLSWIAVIRPDVIAGCPMMPATSPPRSATQQPALPAYQILVVDADTGANGIVYSAKTNSLCGAPGYQPASVAPAAEFVSVPWTLVTRGPGSQSATISYQARPCDQRILTTFAGTDEPVVLADRDQPGLVTVAVERVLTTCGPAIPTRLLLRSSTLKTDLPELLVHAPVGAQDVRR